MNCDVCVAVHVVGILNSLLSVLERLTQSNLSANFLGRM